MFKTPGLLAARAIVASFKIFLALSVLGLAVACVNGGVATPSVASQDGQPVPFKEWQIIDTATGQTVPFDQWAAFWHQQDIIYLGEEHHNRFHIDAALTVLRRLKAEGRKPALAMEMFGWDGQTALDQYVSGLEITRQEFLDTVRWQQNWGGAFEDYEPLVQFAKEHHWTVDAMNPPKPLVRIVAKNGMAQAQSDPLMAQWGMKDENIVDDQIYRKRILEQLQACHGKGDDSFYQSMLEASMFRDEGMAKTLVHRLNLIHLDTDTMAGPLVSYTGAGHIQFNLPVPKRVARRLAGQVRHMSVYMTSFDVRRIEELQTMVRERVADYLWLTPVSAKGLPRRC